ncbi:DUF7065 domain-containing protein [Mycolicibacter senuensis]|uniref:AttH domain-containing protein n=1 Tax=Mycolicibacter senuensis TaxID=386913 RepID=A0A7I9XPY9_9MYCO|nr:hypothetical protein [Mycolicibacter senuensis]GFG72019.1 hypothetical protein MSEN_37390 [Mycolicibacter senuensis]
MTTSVEPFSADDEMPHPIGADPLWQESVFLLWWDRAAGIGGIHRIGHEPGHGISTSWVGIHTRDGESFCQHLNLPFTEADRTGTAFRVGDQYEADFAEGKARWTIEETDCEMELVVTDYTPRFDLFRAGGTVTDDFAPGHLEAAGRVRGSIRLGEKRYEIDGLCYRDHSWGKRDWATLLSHRWIAGTCGPELTFNAASWHGVDGSLRSFGIVARDGVVTHADTVDILVFMETDAMTHRGGVVAFELPGGETIRIDIGPPIGGGLTTHNGVACVDELCEFEYGGSPGFCDFEITTNPRGGSDPVSALVRATMEKGLSRREWSTGQLLSPFGVDA